MNLYEIHNQIENFEFEFDEVTGEVTNIDELNNLKLEKNEKIENIALYIKNLKADEKAIDEEIKALQARRKAKTNKMDNLSNYLKKTLDGAKFESPKVKISWRKSSKVIVNDETEFLKENETTNLVKREVKLSLNKKAIKEALQEKEIKGAYIEETKNIQIK